MLGARVFKRLPPPGVFAAGATLAALVIAAIALQKAIWAIVFAVPAAILIAAEVFVVVRSARRQDLRNLENDAYTLASSLRDLLSETPLAVEAVLKDGIYSDLTPESLQKAQAQRSQTIVAQYDSRYYSRARRIAGDLRQHELATADAFYHFVERGPESDEEVFQIATGFERIARELADD